MDELKDGLKGSLEAGDLDRLVGHLREQEAEAQEATLSSLESFEMWVATHPALRQMQAFENIAQIGPALIQVLRRLLGL